VRFVVVFSSLLFACAGVSGSDCPNCRDLANSPADAAVPVDATAVVDAAKPADMRSLDLGPDLAGCACVPGTTRPSTCDPCSEETCTPSCTWSACALKVGNACEYRGGTHTRSCNLCSSCGGSQLQWCLSSCQWSTACACCTASCVGC
jgi:hypothetical protein